MANESAHEGSKLVGDGKKPRLYYCCMGPARRLSTFNKKEKVYLTVIVVSALTLVGFTGYRLTAVGRNNADFAFCLVVIINSAFSVVYVFDSIARQRPSELLVLTIAVSLLIAYLVTNYARMIVGCCLFIPIVSGSLYLCYKYTQEERFIFDASKSVFKKPQVIIRRLHYFQDFLKFDCELQLSLLVLELSSKNSIDSKDIIILSVGTLVTIAWFFIGFIGFSKEIKKLVILFYLLSLLGIAYLIYRMPELPEIRKAHIGLFATTITCGICGFLVRGVVMILGYLVYRGFGYGTNQLLHPQDPINFTL